MRQVIEAGTFHRGIAEWKSTGLDDVDGDTHACSESDDRSDVGRNIGLEQGNAH
jgi:hypothetical protein